MDGIVPPSVAEAWVAASTKAGDQARFVRIEGAGHFEVIAPTSMAFPAVRSVVVELLNP
jgi:hypothetical protein